MRFGESSEPLDTDQCKSMESQKNLQKSMEFPEKLAENDQKHIHIIKIKKSHQLSYSIENLSYLSQVQSHPGDCGHPEFSCSLSLRWGRA